MKLKKLKLNELSNSDLNEREMVRILGGGEPGCCQCGCNYEGQPGGSSTSSNDSANDANGYTSDPGSHPCDCYPNTHDSITCDPWPQNTPACDPLPVDMPCNQSSWGCR